MLKNVSLYSLIGVFNTGLHWSVFYLLINQGIEQSYSNLVAFLCAASFSFIVNAKYNFKSEINLNKYFLFLGFMGILSFSVGFVSDGLLLNPLFTLVVFSLLSFILGFLYSKFVVFR